MRCWGSFGELKTTTLCVSCLRERYKKVNGKKPFLEVFLMFEDFLIQVQSYVRKRRSVSLLGSAIDK